MELKPEESMFGGAVSVQPGEGWWKPWRLPWDRLSLYPSSDDALRDRAADASGVRLRFHTDSANVGVGFRPMAGAHRLDLTVEGDLLATQEAPDGSTSVTFDDLPAGGKIVEIWLPQDAPIQITGVTVDDGASCRPAEASRPRWVTYGSSLTHCTRAHSPARTWPAIAARRKGYDLTSLGYGGNCCLEPMIGIMIRDLPADLITLKLGINCISGALSPRTFAAAVTGLVQIIREKKPHTPIGLISPIGFPPHETEPNVLGYTIEGMRADIEQVHARLVERGDANLQYFNGLDVFGLAQIERYAEDKCHPDGDGIEVMAENFLRCVLDRMPSPRRT